MDPMVSARVPLELRDQVNEGLREIGSSPTELINSAYIYFLEHKSLPGENKTPKKGRKHLSARKSKELARSIEETTLCIPEEIFKDKSYKDVLRRDLRNEYESLS